MSSELPEQRGIQAAISVRGLGKKYEVFHSPTDRLRQTLTGHKRGRDIWAIKDVSFDVMPGEAIGIIGRNGSGKSTLMQIIAGTLAPTVGEVHIRGRLAALLELGSGFNPYFTGRENAILSGSIMGLSRKQMEARLPEIEDFAEIGDFIDEQVSIYSSGMHARLAFAVSVALEPDILILDEILSVGDAGFQQRCIGRLHQLLAGGVTLLFVSHAADAVKSICRKGLLLVKGEQVYFGSAREAVDLYFSSLRTQQSARSVQRYEELADRAANAAIIEPSGTDAAIDAEEPPPLAGRYGTGHARFESVRCLDKAGRPREGFEFGEVVVLELTFKAATPILKLDVIVRIRDKSGVDLFGISINEEVPKAKLTHIAEGRGVRVIVEFINTFRAGPHGVTATLIRAPNRRIGGGEGVVTLDHIDTAAAFESLPRAQGVVRGKFQYPCRVSWEFVERPIDSNQTRASAAAFDDGPDDELVDERDS